MSQHADNLLDFVNEFGHLWDADRVEQVKEAAKELNRLQSKCELLERQFNLQFNERHQSHEW